MYLKTERKPNYLVDFDPKTTEILNENFLKI